MPKLEKLTQSEVEQLKRRRVRTQDITEYLSYMDSLRRGDWGRVTLQEGDKQRVVKRRLTTAAKQKGKRVRYKAGKGEEGQIIFEVV